MNKIRKGDEIVVLTGRITGVMSGYGEECYRRTEWYISSGALLIARHLQHPSSQQNSQ